MLAGTVELNPEISNISGKQLFDELLSAANFEILVLVGKYIYNALKRKD